MQYNQHPSIIHTDPKRFSTSVHVGAKIVIAFDSDIEKTSIANNVHLYDSAGRPVEIRCSYKDKTITATPREKLSSEETYRVVVHGDNNPEGTVHEGIQSIIGAYMLGDYDFVFTTKNQLDSLEVVVDGSPNEITINAQPEFKFHVAVNTGADSTIVELQLSKSKSFDSIIWTGTTTPGDALKGIKAGIYLTDGTYFWRARVTRADNHGTWSETYQFNLNTVPRVAVVEDDTIPLDINFPSDWELDTPTVLTVWPANNVAAVPVNTQVIAVTLSGIIRAEDIDFDSLYITCEPNITFTNASGGITISSRKVNHDEIDGDIDVVHNLYDNTTVLIFKLKPIDDTELFDYESTIQAVYKLKPHNYLRLKPAVARVSYTDYEHIIGGCCNISQLSFSDAVMASGMVVGVDYVSTLPAEAKVV